MDKFGIFNLLSSLAGGLSAEKGENPSAETPPHNDKNFFNTPVRELLSSFLSGNGKGKNPDILAPQGTAGNAAISAKPENTKPESAKNAYSAIPLSSKMLSTMKTHDEIGARVKNGKG